MRSRIGPYEIMFPLGSGGMGETYVAERRGPGEFVQRVCLKRIRADRAQDPDLARQLMGEATIVARLRHATIVQVLDFGQADGELYLAMELVEGLDLRELLETTTCGLPAELVAHLAVELATALDVAHRSPDGRVIHRDVSPSNVLISTRGESKLADFGIARRLDRPAHTQTGIVRGKVPYLAPEYARTGRCDERCDLFSLGVMLYECAAGARPFDGATDLETLELAAQGKHVRLHERVPSFPAELASVIEQLIAPEPDARYPSAHALLETLLALPHSSRARQELGARVTAARAARPSAPESTPEDPSAAREPKARTRGPGPANGGDSPDPHADTEARPSRGGTERISPSQPAPRSVTLDDELRMLRPKRRTPLVVLGLGLALALVTLLLWLAREAPAPHVPEATGAAPEQPKAEVAAHSELPTQASAENSVAPEPTAPSEPRPEPAAEAESTTEAATTKGTVEVVVIPYGEVFVGGRSFGQGSPVNVRLRPGTHTIVAHTPRGTLRANVEVKAGKKTRVVLE